MNKKNILIFTGAGISAGSGLSTFRDSNGMWNNFNISEVCSVEALECNFPVVLDFYNMRRKDALAAKPNAAHLAIVELSNHHNVTIITQNVDNLHEQAGSTDVIHLHGEITKARDMVTGELVECVGDMNVGDVSSSGNRLRPHIVLFGEAVPEMASAAALMKNTTYDYLIIIGTSLHVYPAANITWMINDSAKLIIVDPVKPVYSGIYEWREGTAVDAVPALVKQLMELS